jgi:mannose-6-phosphate isomerase-like protein (cupin superfamily)
MDTLAWPSISWTIFGCPFFESSSVAQVLHTHPYEEVFVTLEGEATFTVGDETIEVSAGQIVVAPAGVPHKFVNSGTGPLRQVDIHPSGRIRQDNIPGGS